VNILPALALIGLLSAPVPQVQEPSPQPAPSPELAALLLDADARFARRSSGAIDEVANPTEVDAAIALYKQAAALAPGDVGLLARLLRAMHFRGAYTGASVEEKKAIFEAGRKLGQEAVDRIEAQAKRERGFSRIEALRLVKGAPELYLWTAGHWGEWALVRGKFAAARSGIAGRLRDLSQTVIDLDPVFEDAAGYRLLGRLHSEAPKVPLITGWVSRDKALQYLRQAYATGPRHPVTWYFLAEAILDHQPNARDEALRLLEKCANTPPRPDTLLEDARYAALARKRLEVLVTASGQ
jgi:tetratricopeptide (TPR) repeat protein